MSKFWKREEPLERELRTSFEATPEFEKAVSRQISESTPRVRYARASRGSFAMALAVFMLGTFASFGGVSMAAQGAKQTVSAVSHLTVSQKPTAHRTAATDEYTQAQVKPAHIVKVKATPKKHSAVKPTKLATTKTTGTLPFTGLSLLATAVLSLLFLGSGLLLRRAGARANRSI